MTTNTKNTGGGGAVKRGSISGGHTGLDTEILRVKE